MRLYTTDLIKKYKSRTVVDHVSIDVRQGESVGLLGPNGAGKTTSFYMIVGLIKPNGGRIFSNSPRCNNNRNFILIVIISEIGTNSNKNSDIARI